MSFLQKLRKTFSGGSNETSPSSFYDLQVRCRRCGEILTTRINLANDLSMDYETNTYHVRKLLVGTGANRCFQRVELELTFDADRQLVHREAIGGTFVDSMPADTKSERA